MQSILLYIHPGSGSYLIQMIIAGILGVAFFFKNIVFAVKHFFHRIFGKKS
jgi:ATP-dependent Zn protease